MKAGHLLWSPEPTGRWEERSDFTKVFWPSRHSCTTHTDIKHTVTDKRNLQQRKINKVKIRVFALLGLEPRQSFVRQDLPTKLYPWLFEILKILKIGALKIVRRTNQ